MEGRGETDTSELGGQSRLGDSKGRVLADSAGQSQEMSPRKSFFIVNTQKTCFMLVFT